MLRTHARKWLCYGLNHELKLLYTSQKRRKSKITTNTLFTTVAFDLCAIIRAITCPVRNYNYSAKQVNVTRRHKHNLTKYFKGIIF